MARREDRPATLPLQGEPAAQSSWMRSRQVVASDHVSQALFRDEWLELALVQGLKVSIGPGMLRYTMRTDDDGALFFYISLWPDFPSYAIPVHVPHITLAYKCTFESSEVMYRSYFAALKLLLPRQLHVRLSAYGASSFKITEGTEFHFLLQEIQRKIRKYGNLAEAPDNLHMTWVDI